MAKFTFQVDRVHKVVQPFTVHSDVGLMTEPFELAAGTQVVYRGLVEIGGTDRYVFQLADDAGALGEGKKVYTRDRASFENALEEDFGALIRP
jgi:hypothetical protein